MPDIHKNNLYSFLKMNLEFSPPKRVGAFYVWIGILDEFLAACGVQGAKEEANGLFDDLDKENTRLFDTAVVTEARKRVDEINDHLREEKNS